MTVIPILVSVWIALIAVGSFLGAYAMATGTTPWRHRKRIRARVLEKALHELHARELVDLKDMQRHSNGWGGWGHEFHGHYHWNQFCRICGWPLRFHTPEFIIEEDPVLQALGGQS